MLTYVSFNEENCSFTVFLSKAFLQIPHYDGSLNVINICHLLIPSTSFVSYGIWYVKLTKDNFMIVVWVEMVEHQIEQLALTGQCNLG